MKKVKRNQTTRIKRKNIKLRKRGNSKPIKPKSHFSMLMDDMIFRP